MSLRNGTRFAVYGVPMRLLARHLEHTPQPITLPYLLAHGGRPGKPPTPEELLRSAQYTQKELPVRLARRVRQFYSLPFIVGTNPYIQDVARLYASSFQRLCELPAIHSLEDNDVFTHELRELVHEHADLVPTLARGFMECKMYMDNERISRFLDAALHSRIGIRLIAEQHLALTESAHKARNSDDLASTTTSPTSVGIIDTQMSPVEVIQQSGAYVQALCEATFEMAPVIQFEGDLDARTVGIPVHLDYVMTELLKNSFRATTEMFLSRHPSGSAEDLPPIIVTLSSGASQITIRIRDEGGGIPPENMSQIFSYAFTSVPTQSDEAQSGDDAATHGLSSSMGTLAGLGYGLPLSRLYLNYFGDSDLDIVSLYGYGCDTFVKLSRLIGTSNVQI